MHACMCVCVCVSVYQLHEAKGGKSLPVKQTGILPCQRKGV